VNPGHPQQEKPDRLSSFVLFSNSNWSSKVRVAISLDEKSLSGFSR
jgi:hypothetical protein